MSETNFTELSATWNNNESAYVFVCMGTNVRNANY